MSSSNTASWLSVFVCDHQEHPWRSQGVGGDLLRCSEGWGHLQKAATAVSSHPARAGHDTVLGTQASHVWWSSPQGTVHFAARSGQLSAAPRVASNTEVGRGGHLSTAPPAHAALQEERKRSCTPTHPLCSNMKRPRTDSQ